jgi:hypothetical protein
MIEDTPKKMARESGFAWFVLLLLSSCKMKKTDSKRIG